MPRIHSLRVLVSSLCLAACSSGGSAQPARDTAITGSARRVPALDGKLTVPEGFKVAYFARDVRDARMMALASDGAVYLSQPSQGRVTRLVDRDGDGVAEASTIAVDGLNRPHGLAFHDGYLYIANTDALVRVRLGPDGLAAGKPERIARYDGGQGHWTRTVIVGPDRKLYVAIGSSCNICVESQAERATVMRYDADGGNAGIFARGLRNAVGLAVHPVTKEIWATTHERDNLRPEHENLPPEEIDILREGGDYGWPYCWGDRVPNPEFARETGRCASTLPPALTMQAHSAPLGITFLDRATAFPGDYRDDALVAFHGSWNRSAPTGAKVVRVHVEKNRPVSYEDFVTGWQTASGSRWGRPVDVLVYKDGSVLISDDQGGAIFRVYR